MENKKRKIKTSVKYFLYSFWMVVFSVFGYFLLATGLDNKVPVTLNYKEDNSVDYKVFLKPNNFFETPYLPKNSTYISSLIDYVDITFNFNINFDKPVTGSYTYFIRTSLLANKSDNDKKSYWTKESILKNNVSKDINKVSTFGIAENIKIDYQEYNDLLTSFKKEYGLSVDGILKVELVVKTSSKLTESPKEINDESEIEVDIPLTQSAVEIALKTEAAKKDETIIVDELKLNDKQHRIELISGVLSTILVLILAIGLYKTMTRDKKSQTHYAKELKRILTTYDSIIVNVQKVRDLTDYNVIAVNSFSELLDAHSEIRMPINFMELEKDKECVFILINNDVAWIYRMKNE